jgi:hypothetical protein
MVFESDCSVEESRDFYRLDPGQNALQLIFTEKGQSGEHRFSRNFHYFAYRHFAFSSQSYFSDFEQ